MDNFNRYVLVDSTVYSAVPAIRWLARALLHHLKIYSEYLHFSFITTYIIHATKTTSTKLTVSSHAIYWYISSSALYAHICTLPIQQCTLLLFISIDGRAPYSPFQESNTSAIKPFSAAAAAGRRVY